MVTERSRSTLVYEEPPAGLLTYPINRVIALMDDPDLAAAAIDELIAAGFPRDDMHILCGPSGAESLDLSGLRQPLGGHLYRFSGYAGEREDLKTYARHMDRGGLVVSVPVDPDSVEVVARVVERHGGHGMSHYGRGRRVALAPPSNGGEDPQPATP